MGAPVADGDEPSTGTQAVLPVVSEDEHADATDQRGDRRRARRRLALGGVAAVVVVIVAATLAGQVDSSSVSVKESGSAPGFVLENVRPGEPPVSLEKLRGKPLVLNFWASWCGPCRREMPGFEAVHQRVQDRIRFVGVDNQDFRNSALDLLRQTGVSYPSGFDPKGNVASQYGLIGMPTTVFISRDGRLLERRTGEMNQGQLEETIDRLFPSRDGR
jgi:cytochrome c biogenesis protein CcmG/thiol:disulfide interchange protein DsbE